jgi:hypothetical protein
LLLGGGAEKKIENFNISEKNRFWVLAFGVCEKNKTRTQYTHTSCGKKECLFTQHSFDG